MKFDYSNNDCIKNSMSTNLELNSDFEDFIFPDVNISGTTKISSGLTINSAEVYNFNSQSGLTINFIFTGNTSSFNKVHKFGYDVQKWVDETSGFTQTVYNKEIDFSNTFTYNDFINTNELKYNGDSEYIINLYYIFSGNTLPLGNTIIFNTKDFILPNLEYSNYSENYSGYFSIYNEPNINLSEIGEVRLFEGTYNYEVLDLEESGQTEFFISKTPTKIINLNLNGLSLLYGNEILGEIEYTNDLNKIIIKSGLTSSGDIITIQYIADDNQPEFYVDSFYVNDLTDRIQLNTGTTKYEFLLENTPSSDVNLILNGLKLNEGIDFYKSITNLRKLIFHETSIEVGDTLIALYQTDFDIGNVYSSAVTINFQSILEQEEGEFLLEVTDSFDTDFLNPIYSASTDYSFGGLYETVKGEIYQYFLTFSPIQINQTYLARIKNTKQVDFVEYTINPFSFSNVITFKAGDNSIESY